MTSDIGMNLLITLCVISYSGYAIGSFVPMLHCHLVILCLHVNQCLAFSLLSQGNVTFSCSEPQLVAATISEFQQQLSVAASTAPILEGFSVRLQFRTWNPDGLLLSNPLISGQEPRYLILQISSGRLHLTHQTSALKMSEVSAGEETLSAPCGLTLNASSLKYAAQVVALGVLGGLTLLKRHFKPFDGLSQCPRLGCISKKHS